MNQNQRAFHKGKNARERITKPPPTRIIGLKPNRCNGFSIKGEAIRTPIYKPVECKPFTEDETPFCSRIIASKGNNIPGENPEIVTKPIKIQQRFFADTIDVSPSFIYKSYNLNTKCFRINVN